MAIRHTGRTVLWAALLFAGSPVLLGQTTSQVNGTIMDVTRAVVPGAEVRIINTDTGAERTVTSDSGGFYTVPSLLPGNYRITVSKQGFRSVTQDGVRLEVNQVARIDFALELGAVTQTLEVVGAAPLIESSTSAIGQVIESKAVEDLPLNGRNFVQLATLGPGVVGVGFGARNTIMSGERPDDLRPGSELFSNGNREGSNDFLLDGVDNMERLTLSISLRPSVEGVREFKIQTNMFAADQGRNSGATVNVITKSGTNRFHGSAYDFLRNDRLDARNFFDNPRVRKPAFRQNQFGSSFGGPIKKDKLFFFANYEGFRKRKETTSVNTVPTAAMRRGDFSEVRDIFDAFTVRPAAGTSSGFTRTVFPNRQIPQSRFDAVTPKLFFGVPLPDLPGLVNNQVTNPKQQQRWDQGDLRVDYNISSRDTVFGRFSRQDTTTIQPSTFPPARIPGIDRPVALGSERSFAGTSDLISHNAVLSMTHTFSPRFLAEGKMGFNRFDLAYLQEGATPGARLGEQLGVKGSNQGPFSDGIPIFFPLGYQEIGQTRSLPIIRVQNTINGNLAFSHIQGPHTKKFGFEVRRRQVTEIQNNRGSGRFNFNPLFTTDPNNTGATGDSIASLLLGTASAIEQDFTLVTPGIRGTEWGFYFEDDYRVNDRLTLNLGIRYELFTRFSEVANRWTNFDVSSGKLLIAGFNSDSNVGVDRDGNNVAPRFGFAYRPRPTTVIRGGYGIFYNAAGNGGVLLRRQRQIPFGPLNVVDIDQFSPNPRRVQDGLPPIPVLDFAVVSNNPTGSLLSVPRNFKNGYVQQYNFGIQQELPSLKMVVKASYVGSLSRQLESTFDFNQPAPGPGPPGSRRPLRNIAPGVVGVSFNPTDGLGHYQSLQVSAERRFSAGLAFLTAYTYSHSIDNVSSTVFGGAADGPLPQDIRNRRAERGTSGFDITQRLVQSVNYNLPFGSGRRFSFSNPLANKILGDWQTNLILTAQTGLPFTPVLQNSVSNAGGSRPDRLKTGTLSNRDPAKWFDTSFNQPGAAWATPLTFTFGNSGRNVLRAPGRVNFDCSIFKGFAITERYNLQFRAEFFNLFNTPQFDVPNANIGSPTAGVISSIVGTPRDIQLALRLVF